MAGSGLVSLAEHGASLRADLNDAARYVAGRWDDNGFNVYDRENGNRAVAAWGYMSLSEAQEAARRLNEQESEHRERV